jgi:luciferase family oxidoreductase group 1
MLNPEMPAPPFASSVLDLSLVGEGSTPAAALANSLDLVQRVEQLGFHRYWVAEHHNLPGVASSSPAVLLAHAASVTSTIRVGSGGVMLPNHAPLVIAEQFGMLEALHPGRVDLGIGRAPGTDQLTAQALRRSGVSFSEDEFPAQLTELFGYFTGSFPEGHPYRSIVATPGRGYQPEIWLLGSSDYSARAAGLLGLPFSFAHHFSGHDTDAAVDAYRSAFRPSDQLAAPYVMLGVAVVAADTDEQGTWLAGPSKLSMLRLRSGRPGRYPTPEEAAAFRFTPHERRMADAMTESHIVGAPDRVRRELVQLAERTGADELMVTTMVHGHDHRLRSYELVAEALELDGLPSAPRSVAS